MRDRGTEYLASGDPANRRVNGCRVSTDVRRDFRQPCIGDQSHQAFTDGTVDRKPPLAHPAPSHLAGITGHLAVGQLGHAVAC